MNANTVEPARTMARLSQPFRMMSWSVAVLVTSLSSASGSIAQTAPITIRELSAPQSATSKPFGLILQIHAFSDGRVLVNDGGARRLILLNKTLGEESVLLDSLNGEPNFYGPRASPIIRYTGDSALYVDGRSSTLLLISPAGKIARTISLPKPSDMTWLASSASGADATGNLVYRGRIPPGRPLVAGPEARPGAVTRGELLTNDSLPIVRANFDTRRIDTVAYIGWPAETKSDNRRLDGKPQQTVFHNPLLTFDEWAVTSEGLVAVVYGATYRIKLLDAAGKQIADNKIPFDWRAISEAERQHLIDSARSRFDTSAASRSGGGSSIRGPRGGITTVRAPINSGATSPPLPIHVWITPNEMPAYWPSIRQGAVTADLDGNVWILPATSSAATNGALVYDVVNNKGVLTSRVRLPVGRVIAGFGRGGVVYTSMKQENGGWILESRSLK